MALVLLPDGPGTTIEVRDGFQGLPPAPRGTAAILGQFPSGPVTHAALAASPEIARLISGDPDDNFEASLAMDDVYSEDSPPMLIGRITDGNEIQGQLPIWDRDPSRSLSITNLDLVPDRAPLATIKAQNGGRWGGRRTALVGVVAAIATDLTTNELDISTAPETPAAGSYLADRYKDALLYLEGDPASPYTICCSDDQGVVQIKGDFSQAAQDADGTGAIDGTFQIVLEDDRELTAVISQDSVVEKQFTLTALRKYKIDGDWEAVSQYNNLDLDPNDSRPWVQIITDGELARYQIEVDTTYTGATVEAKLPANFCEVPTDVTGATLTFQWWRAATDPTNTGTSFVTGVAPVDANSILPHVYTLTMAGAGPITATVVVTWPDGVQQTLGTATEDVEFDPGHPQLAKFTLKTTGAGPWVGDTMTIRVNPMPSDLAKREAFVYPIALSSDGNTSQRLRIVKSTYNSISIRSDLLFSDFGATVGTPATGLGTVDLTAYSSVIGETVILTPDDGSGAITLTFAAVDTGVDDIATALNGLTTVFTFDEDPDNAGRLRVRVNGSYGSKSKITFGAGTAHAGLGLPTTGEVVGTDAIPFRIEARMPMWGGYDGIVPGDARYLIGLDLSDHIFKQWLSVNLGLVRVATPGVTSTDVKAAVDGLCTQNGWIGIAEFDRSLEDVSLPDAAAVADMVANEPQSDYMEHYFPSRGKFLNVANTKLVTRSISGVVMGVRSRLANVGTDNERGFHLAAANNNVQGQISPRVKALPDGIGRWVPQRKLLNDHGIVPVLWEGPDIFLYGNRMYSQGRTPAGSRYTITERAVYYHVARDLFVTTRPFIFKSISARRLADVQLALRDKMKVYYNDGWFSDFGGTAPGFEQQVQVEVPPSLNPPADLQEGKVTASIIFRPRPALENLKIIISPTSLQSEAI